MSKKICFLTPIFISISLLAFLSCNNFKGDSWFNAGNVNGYTNTYLPSKFSISIPASLKSQSSSLKRSTTTEISFGYKQLKEQVTKMEQFSAGFELQFMLIDKMYGQLDDMFLANNKDGTLTVATKGLSVNFTKDISEKFITANANLEMTLRDYLELRDIVGGAVGKTFYVPKEPVIDKNALQIGLEKTENMGTSAIDFQIISSNSESIGNGYWDGSKAVFINYWGNQEQVANSKIYNSLDLTTPISDVVAKVLTPQETFSYKKDESDTDSDGYHHIINYDGIIGPNVSHLVWDVGKKNTKIKWSTDRNKISVVKVTDSPQMEKTVIADSNFTSGIMTVKIIEKGKANSGGAERIVSVTLEETGENNGVKISSKETHKIPNGTTIQTDSYEISGTADDNGGFIVTTFSSKQVNSTTGATLEMKKYSYTESFDGNGKLTGLSSDDPAASDYAIGDPKQSTYYDETGVSYSMVEKTWITVSWPTDIGTQVKAIFDSLSIEYINEFNYAIVLNTAPDPNTDVTEFYSFQIGSGYYNQLDAQNRWTDYTGTSEQISSAVIYLEVWHQNTQQNKYFALSGVSISETTEPEDTMVVPPDPTEPTTPKVSIEGFPTSGTANHFFIMPAGYNSTATAFNKDNMVHTNVAMGQGFYNGTKVEHVEYTGMLEPFDGGIVFVAGCPSNCDTYTFNPDLTVMAPDGTSGPGATTGPSIIVEHLPIGVAGDFVIFPVASVAGPVADSDSATLMMVIGRGDWDGSTTSNIEYFGILNPFDGGEVFFRPNGNSEYVHNPSITVAPAGSPPAK